MTLSTADTQLDLEAQLLAAQGCALLPDWLYLRAVRAGLELPRLQPEGVRVPACQVPVPVGLVEEARRAAGLCGRSPMPRPGEHYDEGEEEVTP